MSRALVIFTCDGHIAPLSTLKGQSHLKHVIKTLHTPH